MLLDFGQHFVIGRDEGASSDAGMGGGSFGVGMIDDMSFVCLLAIFALSLELSLLLLQVGICFRGLLEVL